MPKKKKEVTKVVSAPQLLDDLLLTDEEPATTSMALCNSHIQIKSPLEVRLDAIEARLFALELAHAKPEKPKAICVQEPCQPNP